MPTIGGMAPTSQSLLDDLDDLIQKRLRGGAVQRFVVGGRDLTVETMSSLLKLREQLTVEARIEGQSSDFLLADLRDRGRG